jgi:hypothetical protein
MQIIMRPFSLHDAIKIASWLCICIVDAIKTASCICITDADADA